MLTIIFKSYKKKETMLLPEQLYSHIPQKVQEWETSDVQKWFAVNNIQIHPEYSFQKEGFNGRAFVKTTPEYLLEICGVSSLIIMKKILEWIEYDREQFEEYVYEHSIKQSHLQYQSQPYPSQSQRISTELQESNNGSKFEVEDLPTEKNKENTSKSNIVDPNEGHKESIMPYFEVQKWKKRKPVSEESIGLQRKSFSRESINPPINKSDHCIPLGANFVQSSYEILESAIEFKHDSKCHILTNSGKIGRGVCNDIIIVAESVSRKHAGIIKEKDEFYFKDEESRFGTFIQIGTKNRKKIAEGDIIAFEDSQIQILKFKYYKKNNTFDLRIRKAAQQVEILNFYSKKSLTIGRQGKDIAFPNDKISANHARITVQSLNQLVILGEQGRCFKKLAKDELIKLEPTDTALRLGLAIVNIKINSNHKPISINEIDQYKH